MFSDFFNFFADLNSSGDFSIIVRNMYEALPSVFIGSVGILFVIGAVKICFDLLRSI